MATQKEMYELVGRAVVDEAFRAKLVADPEHAAKEGGYDLTPEQLNALQSADLKGLAEVLHERLPKYFWI
jgi:hypothetical protein